MEGAAALGLKSRPQAKSDDVAAATLSVFITGTLVFAFRLEGEKWWWDCLDQIWSACERAEGLDLSAVQALQVRLRIIEAAKERGTASD